MSSTFYYNTDVDGKMPRLSEQPEGAAWIKYVDDRPVIVKLHDRQDRVWDYKSCEMLALVEGILKYDGSPMPMYVGEIIRRCDDQNRI